VPGAEPQGEPIMELRVQLKVCEGCGCLWYRSHTHGSIYCRNCAAWLAEFPPPQGRLRTRKRRPAQLKQVWAVAESAGGAE